MDWKRRFAPGRQSHTHYIKIDGKTVFGSKQQIQNLLETAPEGENPEHGEAKDLPKDDCQKDEV